MSIRSTDTPSYQQGCVSWMIQSNHSRECDWFRWMAPGCDAAMPRRCGWSSFGIPLDARISSIPLQTTTDITNKPKVPTLTTTIQVPTSEKPPERTRNTIRNRNRIRIRISTKCDDMHQLTNTPVCGWMDGVPCSALLLTVLLLTSSYHAPPTSNVSEPQN